MCNKINLEKEKPPITNIRNDGENLQIDPTNDKNLRKQYKQVYANCDKSDEIDIPSKTKTKRDTSLPTKKERT